jgi:hypothetical protein
MIGTGTGGTAPPEQSGLLLYKMVRDKWLSSREFLLTGLSNM